LRLGALVVHFSADEKEATDTRYRLQNSIKHHARFSPSEREQLQTYLLHRLNALENIEAVKTELAYLALNKKRRVRHILLTVIFADNHFTPSQRHYIENLYLALGLSKLVLENDMNAFMTSNKMHLNPQNRPKLQVLTPPTTTFTEDKNTLSEKVTASYGQKSLTSKREQLYKHLLLKEKWSHAEFNHLCKRYKLTPNGAIEIINNWAYQQTKTSVLHKKDNAVFVNASIVAKIQQKTAIAQA